MSKGNDNGRLITEEDELTRLEKRAIKSVKWNESGYRLFMCKEIKGTTEFSVEAIRRLWRKYLTLLEKSGTPSS